MEAYTSQAGASKSSESFELTPQPRVTRRNLPDWVTRALADIKPWTWELVARLGRTWKRNPHHNQGQHSKERGAREAQLAGDVARLHRTRYFIDCQRLPWQLRASYFSVIGQVKRLLDAGEWWRPRRYVVPRTGELKETLYLPEDTWSAQTALSWCVAILDRLLAAVPRVTEKLTPRYRPGERTPASYRGREALSVEETRAFLAEVARRRGGAQPELPATR